MNRKRITAVAAFGLLAVSVFAGGLSKYKSWDKSPQGVLMTSAERAEWANVKTDDEADTFVKDFLAKRKPEFVSETARAATAADKYFTTGKTPGSATERGRLVIVLGPPGGLSMSERQAHGDVRGSTDSAMTVSGASAGRGSGGGGGGGQGASVTDMMGATNAPGNISDVIHIFTFTYSADKLPAAYGKSLTVSIELDASGKDYVADKKVQAELERVYEMAAEARVAPTASMNK